MKVGTIDIPRDAIRLDETVGPCYWYDIDGMGPKITIPLCDTMWLIRIVDELRTSLGYRPYLEESGEKPDTGVWYDFWIDIDARSDPPVGTKIEAVVVNADADDNEHVYSIEIPEESRREMYDVLNARLIEEIGEGCDALIAEALTVK